MDLPSKSQVNKAGKVLRSWLSKGDPATSDIAAAFEILWAWRAAHQYPLIKANNGLRSVVRTEGCQVEVSQRLKRIPTILDKLMRQPTMQLSTMQDLGGCRAILDSVDEVRRVQRRLANNRPPLRLNDYIIQPRDSGYRGVHLIVCYDDRAIEVQLRTKTMHDWAIAVERFSGRIGEDLKSSRGPEPVLKWLGVVSEAMAIEEAGGIVSEEMSSTVESLRSAALPYLRR